MVAQLLLALILCLRVYQEQSIAKLYFEIITIVLGELILIETIK